MVTYEVTAVAVQVIAGNRVHIIGRGHTLPDDVAQADLDHLRDSGMIKPVSKPTPDPAPAKPTASKK